MVQEYDLDRLGKKMPFSAPDGFFERMQANVLAEVAKEEEAKKVKGIQVKAQAKSQRKAKMIRLYMATASIAACVCLLVLIGRSFFGSEAVETQHSAASVATVDKAYDNLSADEQQELNATYANDVYLCME